MARWNDLPWREEVYEVAARWRERCFFNDTALLSNSDIWTLENFIELKELTLNKPIHEKMPKDDDGVFLQKLNRQLVVNETASFQAIQLAAELVLLIYLLPTNNSLGWKTKVSRIDKVLSWHKFTKGMQVEDNINAKAFHGIASPGFRFNSDIYRQWVYLVSMFANWKSRSFSERNQFRAQNDCWKFADQWDARWNALHSEMREFPNQALRKVDIQPHPQIRHWLMFVLYPDRFERIVSLHDKKLICRDMACLVDSVVLKEFLAGGGYKSQVAVDRLLLEIRKTLELQMRGSVDFYSKAKINALWGENESFPSPSNALIYKTLQIKNSEDIEAPSYDDVSTDPSINPKLEGKPVLRKHYVRERDRTLRQRKLDEVSKIYGTMFCYCCGTDGAQYGNVNLRIFEVHHHIPLSEYDGGKITDLSEVSVLCANCHRGIHASNPMKTVDQFKEECAFPDG